MKNFFLFSFGYAVFSVILAHLTRENATIALNFEVYKLLARALRFFINMKFVGIVLLILLYLNRHHDWRLKAANTAYAFFGCLLFCAAFSITKTTIPFLVPFYADALLADIDKALHFGVDPWMFTHRISDHVTPALVETIYIKLWALPSFFLPVFIALTDNDKARSNRFVVLYCTCWILLGNVLALALSSVGPVYYDFLLEDNRFADLRRALETSGITDSVLGQVQAYLWHDYANQAQAFASGISAFPSLHVGMAVVIALYMTERSSYLLVPGLAFLGAVLFCSVYLGYHYAIDGYASIGIVVAIWALQKRRAMPVAEFAPA